MPRSDFRRRLEDKAVLPPIVSLSFVDAEALYALDKATGGLSLGRCPPHTLLYLLKSTTEGFRRQEKAGLVLTAIQLIVNGCQHLSGMADGLRAFRINLPTTWPRWLLVSIGMSWRLDTDMGVASASTPNASSRRDGSRTASVEIAQ